MATSSHQDGAYAKLVQNDEDLIGLIAFAQFKGENSRPTAEQITAENVHLTSGIVKGLRIVAADKLQEHASGAVLAAEGRAKQAVLGAIQDLHNHVTERTGHLNQHVSQRTSFWMAVLAGFIATVGFVLFFGIGLLILKSEQDPLGPLWQTLKDKAANATQKKPE